MNRQRFPYLLFSLVFIPFLLLYGLTTNQLFSFDAITNAIACEVNEPPRWFHSNHPLYPFLGVLWFKFESLLGYHGYAIYSLARLNTLLMATALASFFVVLQKEVDRFSAFSVVAFLGVTYSVWHYAVDGRAIGASVFFSVMTIIFLIHLSAKPHLSKLDPVLLALLSTLTILMHGIAIFHSIPLIFWLWKKEKNPIYSLIYMGTLYSGLFIIYFSLFNFVVSPFTKGDFLNWVLGYAAFNGSAKTFESSFWIQNVSQLFSGSWGGWSRSLIAPLPGKGGAVVSAVFGIVVLVGFIVSILNSRKQNFIRQSLVLTLLAWGFLVGIFLIFWSPGQEGFRLHMLIPWAAAFTLSFSGRRSVCWGILLLSSFLFLVNFQYWFFSASFIKNNLGFQVLQSIESKINPGDLVLTADSRSIPDIEVLRPYFFQTLSGGSISGRLMAFKETSMNPLLEQLQRNKALNRQLYFADDIFDPAVQLNVEKNYQLPVGAFRQFLSEFIPKEFFLLPNGRRLYRVEFKKESVT